MTVPTARLTQCLSASRVQQIRENTAAAITTTIASMQRKWPDTGVSVPVVRACFVNGVAQASATHHPGDGDEATVDPTLADAYLSVGELNRNDQFHATAPPDYADILRLATQTIMLNRGFQPNPLLLNWIEDRWPRESIPEATDLLRWVSPTAPWMRLAQSEAAWVALITLMDARRPLAASYVLAATLVGAARLCKKAFMPKIGCDEDEDAAARRVVTSIYSRGTSRVQTYTYSKRSPAWQHGLLVPTFVDQYGNTYAWDDHGPPIMGKSTRLLMMGSPYEARHRREDAGGTFSFVSPHENDDPPASLSMDATIPFIADAGIVYALEEDPRVLFRGWACASWVSPTFEQSVIVLRPNAFMWNYPSLACVVDEVTLEPGTKAGVPLWCKRYVCIVRPYAELYGQ